MHASPDELRGVAHALRTTRGHVEGDLSSLRRAGAVFNSWHSPAADDVRTGLYPMCVNSVGFVTRDLEDLATMLDRAADQLAERLARIRTIESSSRSWFARQPLPEDGSLPRWEREWWTYRPGRFPPSGDSAWMEAATYLSHRGVHV